MLTGSKLTQGAARERIDAEDVESGRKAGWLVDDERRVRTRYEDGLFLTARHLTDDQSYFLTRQADIGQLAGGGVVAGLGVRGRTRQGGERSELDLIEVDAGHGLTPSGELVALRTNTTINIRDIPRIQNLEARFGLSNRPLPPVVNLSGAFVLALRPVEYTANPVKLYPTSITGDRRLEDGQIIEGVAVTLVPFPGISNETDQDPTRPILADRARATIARRVFVEGQVEGISPTVLPIAAVYLERGQIRWVDADLVRREAGVDSTLAVSQLGRRSVRESHLRQYARHLDEVVERLGADDQRFDARRFFDALPPVGPLPAGTLQIANDVIGQRFFPPEVNIELSLMPEDELGVLVQEALGLPPIDLTAESESLETIPILVCIPLPRRRFHEISAKIEGAPERRLLPRLPRPPARLRPIYALNQLRFKRLALPPIAPEPLQLQPWQEALSTLRPDGPPLVYLRRRQLPQRGYVMPRIQVDVDLMSSLPNDVRDLLLAANEQDRFGILFSKSPPEVIEAIVVTLSRTDASTGSPRFSRSVLLNGLLAELSYRSRRRLAPLTESEARTVPPGPGTPVSLRFRPLSQADMEAVLPRFAIDELGEGFDALATHLPEGSTAAEIPDDVLESLGLSRSQLPPNPRISFNGSQVGQVLAQSLRVPEIDLKARLDASPQERRDFALQLLVAAMNTDVVTIRNLVSVVVDPTGDFEVDRRFFPRLREIGEGPLFHLIHSSASDDLNDALDAILETESFAGRAEPEAAQSGLITGLLMDLLQAGWGIGPLNAQQANLVLDQLDAYDGAIFVAPSSVATVSNRDVIRRRLSMAGTEPGGTVIDDYRRLAANVIPALNEFRDYPFLTNVRQRRFVALVGEMDEIGRALATLRDGDRLTADTVGAIGNTMQNALADEGNENASVIIRFPDFIRRFSR